MEPGFNSEERHHLKYFYCCCYLEFSLCLLEGGIFPKILSIDDYCNKSILQLYLLSSNFLLCNCILSY